MRSLAIAVLACIATGAPAAAADLEANKLLIRGYIEEVFNKHQPEASDRFVAKDFIEHNPRLPHEGLAGTKKFLIKVFAAFSDYHGEIQELVAEGDKVAVHLTITGTHLGPMGPIPPTGKKLRFEEMLILTIVDGRVVHQRGIPDNLNLLRQLGLVPTPPESE